jgi:hypothetical protein
MADHCSLVPNPNTAFYSKILAQMVAAGSTARSHKQGQPYAVIIYTLWNIWKERCRRIFQNVAVPADLLAHSIKQDIMAYRQANRAIE